MSEAGEVVQEPETAVQEPETEAVEEKHIILHLYTTNGGTTNNFDLINPTDDLTDLISYAQNKIRKNSLTKQSLQEAFGEAGGQWSDIKQLLNNYVKDNTPKPITTRISESFGTHIKNLNTGVNNITERGQQGITAVSEFAKTRMDHANRGMKNIPNLMPNINIFGKKTAKTAKIYPDKTENPPESTGGSRKMKKTRKIRRK